MSSLDPRTYSVTWRFIVAGDTASRTWVAVSATCERSSSPVPVRGARVRSASRRNSATDGSCELLLAISGLLLGKAGDQLDPVPFVPLRVSFDARRCAFPSRLAESRLSSPLVLLVTAER